MGRGGRNAGIDGARTAVLALGERFLPPGADLLSLLRMPVGGSRASLNSVLNGSFSAGVPNVRLAPRMGRPGINDLQRYWSCLAYRRHGKASLCRATDATGDVALAHHVMHQAAAASTPAPQSA